VRLAWNRGYAGSELRAIERLTEAHEAELMEVWRAYFDAGR
jgi:hypothetical protein